MKNEEQLFEEYLIRNKKKIKKELNRLRNDPIARLYSAAKFRAKKSGMAFTIDKSDISIPEYCPYLGIKLTNISGQGRLQSNVSLDRIDGSLGYIKGNIQVISDLANRIKQEATIAQLVEFAKKVLDRHGNCVV